MLGLWRRADSLDLYFIPCHRKEPSLLGANHPTPHSPRPASSRCSGSPELQRNTMEGMVFTHTQGVGVENALWYDPLGGPIRPQWSLHRPQLCGPVSLKNKALWRCGKCVRHAEWSMELSRWDILQGKRISIHSKPVARIIRCDAPFSSGRTTGPQGSQISTSWGKHDLNLVLYLLCPGTPLLAAISGSGGHATRSPFNSMTTWTGNLASWLGKQ